MRPLLLITLFLTPLAPLARAAPVAPVAADEKSATSGPERGALVIMGGGSKLEPVYRRFVELAGGPDAKIVIVTTAASSSADYDYTGDKHLKFARETIGLKNITIVHTHDREEANTEDFVRPIREADGVWFTGGRQWRLADAYLGTLTEIEFHKLLDRGGAIGGSSAGATIQGSFLIRGDTRDNRILTGDHQHGFGFLRNSAIDQHIVPRRRELDLIRALTDSDNLMEESIDRKALLGLGIDEDSAIVVRKNELEVIGKPDGAVMIYNPRAWTSETPENRKYITLKSGDRYDLSKRAVISPASK